jgi:two-component sensor histidine kinase
MAVIIGLINLQKYKSRDDYHETILEELKEKIYSMAIVQNHLHNNNSFVTVELSKYFKEVIQNLHQSYGHGKNIELNLELDKVVIDISIGIPLGLITNEVLTNSFKYAFNENEKNHLLSVKLKRVNDEITVTFKDNGEGYDSSVINEGMGMELIRDLTNQISGRLSVENKNGIETMIVFTVKD